jgi:hypothetical protein
MKVDAIGVLVKDKDGKVKQHKLGKQAGKRGMGIGVALGGDRRPAHGRCVPRLRRSS